MSTAVSVIIVNYNAGTHLMACLDALQRQTMQHTVVVIDNNSIDDSIRSARDAFPNVRILPLRRNVGFARAVNLGASRFADADGVVVTLNPDTVPLDNFLESIVSPFSADPDIGAVAATLVFASAPTVIASAGIDVHRNGVAIDAELGRVWAPGIVKPVFGPSGGAAAYRYSALRDAGWFPDQFFLYLEDVDLAWRMRLKGWKTLSTSSAVASHVYSASAIEGSPLKRKLLARNRIWTLARCLPAEIWMRDRLSILGFDTLASGYAVTHGDGAALRGRIEAIAGLPARFAERRVIQSDRRVSLSEVDSWIRPPLAARDLLRLRSLTNRLAGGSTGS